MSGYNTEIVKQNIESRKSEETKNRYIGGGIHDNGTLLKFEKGKSPVRGNAYIMFTITDPTGAILTHTEYEPKLGPYDTEQSLALKQTNQLDRMLQILECYYPKDLLNFSGNSFESMVDWMCNLLSMADLSTKVRYKAVYDTNQFASFPKQVKFKFIERMDTTTPEVREIVGIDKFTPPTIVADTEKKQGFAMEQENKLAPVDAPF